MGSSGKKIRPGPNWSCTVWSGGIPPPKNLGTKCTVEGLLSRKLSPPSAAGASLKKPELSAFWAIIGFLSLAYPLLAAYPPAAPCAPSKDVLCFHEFQPFGGWRQCVARQHLPGGFCCAF